MFKKEDIHDLQLFEAMGDFLSKEKKIEKDRLWAKIYEDNKTLVHYMKKKYYSIYLEEEDYEFAYDVALTKSIQTYDSENNKTSFSTYLLRIMANEILMIHRKNKRIYSNNFFETDLADYVFRGMQQKTNDHLDSPMDLLVQDVNNFETIFRQQKLEELFENMDSNILNSKNMTEREKTIMRMWLRRKKQREISEELGISRSYVSRIITKFNKGMKRIKDYRSLRYQYVVNKDNRFSKILDELDPDGIL